MDKRPIKFRVWLEKSSKMIYPSNDLSCIYDDGGCDQHYSLCLIQTLEEDFRNNSPYYDNYTDLEGDKTLLQFTGLLDKNSKEIYEGDILKVTASFWPNHFETSEVKFGDYSCAYGEGYIGDTEYGFYAGGKFFSNSLRNEQFKYEIIGNIFENPELMKQ